MANQKEYKIVINGLEKAVSEVDALLKQLNELEQRLSKVGGKEISVASKEQAALLKEQAKLAQLQTEEGRKQLQSLEKIKAANKEIAQVQKEIAQGIREEDGAYTNTLAGKRAQLSEMKKELAGMDMGDTDAWSKMRDEVGKLNAEVLELEKSYGVFNRQVGNYPEAAKGFANITKEAGNADKAIDNIVGSVDQLKGKQLFQVDVQGQVIQFENLSQAIGEIDDMAQKASAEMLALAAAGKEGTEEYDKLNAEFSEYVSKAAELEKARKYSDQLKDSLSSNTRELDLAVGAFESLISIMQIGAGIAGLFGSNEEEINKAINRTVQLMGVAQGVANLYNKTKQQGTAQNIIWTASLKAAEKAMNSLNISTKLTATGMKILKVAIASTGIGLLVVAIGAVVNLMTKWIEKNREAKKTLSKLTEEQETYRSSLNSIYDAEEKLGLSTDTTTKRMKASSDAIKQMINTFNKFKGGLDISFGSAFLPDVNDIEQVHRNYEILHNRLQDVEEALRKTNKESKKAEFNEQIAGIKQMIALYDEWIEAYSKQQNDYKQKVKDADKQLADLQVDNIKNEHRRKIAEIKKNYDEQLKVVRERGIQVKKLELELEKQYNRLIEAEEKRFAEERRKLLLDTYQSTRSTMQEINTKEYEDTKEFIDMQRNMIENLVKTTPTISPLGDANEFKAQGDKIEETLRKNLQTVINATRQYRKIALSLTNSTRELFIAQDITQYEKDSRSSFGEYLEGELDKLHGVVGDIDGIGAKLNTALLKVRDYFNDENNLSLDKGTFDAGLSKLIANVDHLAKQYQAKVGDMKAEDADTVNTMLTIWEGFSDKRILLEQDMNNRLKAINNDYIESWTSTNQIANSLMLDGYTKQFEELEALRGKFNTPINTGDSTLDFLGDITKGIQSVKKFKSEYELLLNSIKGTSNQAGQEIKDITDAIKITEVAMEAFIKDINEEFKLNLTVDMDAMQIDKILGELSTDLQSQWRDMVSNLEVFNTQLINTEAIKTNLDKAASQVQEGVNELTMNTRDWLKLSASVLQAGVTIATQMAQQVVDMQYNNAMVMIERERDEIDEQLKLIEDAYEKQEEITEAHNDKIESLEDELSTARGDRRLFLLDEINAEMQAREKSFQLQEKLAKQEEELQKKQENLEKKAEEAERKRNKANKGIMLAQAIANTALAVTNALAVQPWFLGVALASIAGAMGAVQVGTIAATKYASGGIIQGNSHAQGGVKVLGGQAEVEGGEFITNKRTTSNNIALLEFINSKKTKINLSDLIEFYASGYNARTPMKFAYAEGGQLPSMSANPLDIKALRNGYQDDRPIYVSVQEIEDVSKRVRNVKALAGYED